MKSFKIGIQLYSLRKVIEEIGMDAVLKKVKELGYDCVEFAGFAGHTAEEIKAMLEKYDLEAISVHQTPNVFIDNAQETIDYLKTIGVKYCVVPWYERGKLTGTPEWENTVKFFNEVADLLEKNGIKMGYHNHDFEYDEYEGKYVIDYLFEAVPKLSPEFDTGWVTYAAESPAKYIEKYADRVEIIHLKDFYAKKLKSGPVYALIDDKGNVEGKDDKADNGFMYKACGSGLLDVPSIVEAADKADVKYLIVEFDESPENEPLEDARLSREYLRSLGL